MKPRIVFMGTPAFAVESLKACLDVGEVVAVVTQPDKPQGRGQSVGMPPVKTLALEKGLPVLQPPKIRGTDFQSVLASYNADVAVVTAYGKILPQDVLDTPRLGCVNVHASLLPRFRGAAPIQRAIAAGDAKTGVCLMQMDAGMDTGAILSVRSLDIGPDDTSASLHERLAALGGDILRADLPRYLTGELKPQAQPTDGIVMAPMISKEEGRLDFVRPAAELERKLRAFTPWPGAYTTLQGVLFKVHKVKLGAGKGEPGEILAASAEGLEVACGEGTSLVMLEVQPEGKRRMAVGEFLAGRRLAPKEKPFGD